LPEVARARRPRRGAMKGASGAATAAIGMIRVQALQHRACRCPPLPRSLPKS
jgi:hypothetical protein